MELANLWVAQHGVPDGLRVAAKSDAGAVLRLMQTAVYTHLHADWHLPGDWIGSPSFVVVPKPDAPSGSHSLTAVLFQKHGEMLACLAATPDPLPAAWVRVAAIDQADRAEALLALMGQDKKVIDGKLRFDDREWFRDARDSREFSIGKIVEGVASGQQVVSASYPVLDDGKLVGVAMPGDADYDSLP